MAVPAEMPVAMPVPEPMVATDVGSIVHEPPVGTSLKAVVPPMQIYRLPMIADGAGVTVTTLVTTPQGSV